MKNLFRAPIICFFLYVLASCVITLNAQIVWTGGALDNNWATAGNWMGGMVPGPTDDVEILLVGAQVIITTGTNAVARKVTIAEASLTIQVMANLTIDGIGSTSHAFLIEESEIINDGLISITNANQDAINMFNTSSFTNNGTIEISNSNGDGLELESSTPGSSFINNGTLILENDGDEGIDLGQNAFFRNSITGIIHIENDEEEAIHLDNTGAQFINEGEIYIYSAGEEGIELDSGASFINARTGYIFISNIALDGGTHNAIEIDGATFINDGTIEIQGGDGIERGVDLDEVENMPGIFTNNGYITIENVEGEGIYIRGTASLFTNNLLINVGLNSSSEDIALIRVNASLINSECGVINMTSPDSISVEFNGIITNEGVFTTVYTGEHNIEGIFTNNGEIATPDGNFNLAMGSNPLMGTGSVTMGAIPRQPSNACLGIPIPALGIWAIASLALLFLIVGRIMIKKLSSVRIASS